MGCFLSSAKCWPTGQILSLYALAGIVVLGFAKIMCHFTLNHKRPMPAAAAKPAGQRPYATDFVKVFVFYLQCLWILGGLNGVQWPQSLSGPFTAIDWLFASSTPRALRPDCILTATARMPVAAQEFLISMLMPVAVMLVLLALDVLAAFVSHLRRRRGFRAWSSGWVDGHKLITQGIVVLTSFLPQLLRAVFGLFACVGLDQAVSPPYAANAVGDFWVSDMSQHCWQGYHKGLSLGAGLPLLFTLCVLLPCSVLAFVLRNRSTLYTDALRHYFFLYSMYKPAAAYWEAIVIVQLSVLVAISVFGVSLGTYYSCMVLAAALWVVLLVVAQVRPYASKAVATAAVRSAACVFFTSFAALAFMPAGTIIGQAEAYGQYAAGVGAAVLVVNVAFVLSVLWQAAQLTDWKDVAAKAHKILNKAWSAWGGVHLRLRVSKHASVV